MTENPMNKPSDKTTTDRTPAPNGHGSNSTRQTDVAAESGAKDVRSSKKNKKKKRHQHDQKPAATQDDAVEVATTAAQPAELSEPIVLDTPQPSDEPPIPPSLDEPTAVSDDHAAAPIEQPAERLRLRMKVWTDPATAKRYLMPSAFMRDLVNGQPISDAMYAYALRDDDIKTVTLTAGEWQALPFIYVQEDGPAQRPERTP